MESVIDLKTPERERRLNDWLKNNCGISSSKRQAMPSDASFRRYFRIYDDHRSYVLMDAPPPECCGPFVAIANSLRAKGLHTPVIFHADIEHGFLLLSDFGDTTYLKALSAENVDAIYIQAMDALAVLQGITSVRDHSIPRFNGDFMQQEWAWHKEWFLHKLLGLELGEEESLLNDCFDLLVESAVSQPQVFMHRDYHSANLMLLPDKTGPGILDFQDAFIGPVTYDLVSLLRDCYIDWPPVKVNAWVQYYWESLTKLGTIDVSLDEFTRWFDWMGLERHLKALFTFARKKVRDNQAQYLANIPRVLKYIIDVSNKYPELTMIHDYYQNKVFPLCAR